VAPRAVARLLGHALEATTIVVPGAAHTIPMTHPQAVVDAVRRKATDPARADAIAADACFSSPVGFRTARPLSGMLLSFATNRRLISVLPAWFSKSFSLARIVKRERPSLGWGE